MSARPWEYSAFAVTVAAVRALSPGWIRVTFAGEALQSFAPWGLDQRIKLVLPRGDGSLAEFGLLEDPTPHPSDWYARWKALPEGERNVLRTYTPAAIRPAQGEIDVDVLLHDPPGPASAWAASVAVGERLWLTGPDARMGWTGYGLHWHPGDASRWLLVGDETAFPAISNILRTLPAGGRARVLIEAGDPRDDTVSPTAPPGADVVLVPRGGVAGEALEAAVHALPADAGADYAWIAGEAGAVTRIRRHLTGLGMPKERVAFLGYWKRGGPLVG